MIRIVLIGLAFCLSVYFLIQIARAARQGNVDWRSIGIATIFVVAALYFRQVTDVGGLI